VTQIICIGVNDCRPTLLILWYLYPILLLIGYRDFFTEFLELNCSCSYDAFPRRVSLLKMSVHVVLPVDILTELALNWNVRTCLLFRDLRSRRNFEIISTRACRNGLSTSNVY
jgi:hypothetical protein